jgi:hypothetical protein
LPFQYPGNMKSIYIHTKRKENTIRRRNCDGSSAPFEKPSQQYNNDHVLFIQFFFWGIEDWQKRKQLKKLSVIQYIIFCFYTLTTKNWFPQKFRKKSSNKLKKHTHTNILTVHSQRSECDNPISVAGNGLGWSVAHSIYNIII